MNYKIRENFWNNTSNKLKIRVRKGKYGIINGETEQAIVPFEYDNIFIYGKELFVLYKCGKIGAVRISEKNNLKVQWIADCVYDTLDERYHNLTFTNDKEYKYYNSYINSTNEDESLVWTFSKMYTEDEYVYGKTDRDYLIIKESDGMQIWQEPVENFKEGFEPCLKFIGSIDKTVLFYDSSSSKILKVSSEKYQWINRFDLVKPIIINGQNVLNIIFENNKIGTVDLQNKLILKPRFDNIKLELKVTMTSKSEKVEKVYEIQNGTFSKGECVPMEDW